MGDIRVRAPAQLSRRIERVFNLDDSPYRTVSELVRDSIDKGLDEIEKRANDGDRPN